MSESLIAIVSITIILATIIVYIIRQYFTSIESKKGAPVVHRPKLFKSELSGPFTADEVLKHNTREDCWIIVDGSVYDITSYIDDHPGGDSILNNAGGDSSIGVHGPQHPISMFDVLALYKIGELVKN